MPDRKLRKRSFRGSTSGLTSTEFALAAALLAIVAALSVQQIGAAMSGSMLTMADNVGGGGGDPVPQDENGDDDKDEPKDRDDPDKDGDPGKDKDGSNDQNADNGKKDKKKKKKK